MIRALRTVAIRLGQFAGGIVAVWGVSLTLPPDGRWWGWFVIACGIALVGVGAVLAPGTGSGVHLARDAMRMFDDGRSVRDPGGTVDPTDGGGRFSGR